MSSLHALIYHPTQEIEIPTEIIPFGSTSIPKLQVSRLSDFGSSQFPVSFELGLQKLEQNFGAYTEGDGSFGFAGGDGKYRVAGTVFESGAYVESLDTWLDKVPCEVFSELVEQFCDEPSDCIVALPNHNLHTTFDGFCDYLKSGST